MESEPRRCEAEEESREADDPPAPIAVVLRDASSSCSVSITHSMEAIWRLFWGTQCLVRYCALIVKTICV